MPLNKIGAPQKIKTIVSNEKEFEQLKEQIVSSNNLARCVKCGKLLAKIDHDLISVKRKDIDMVAKVSSLEIKCPVCKTCNSVPIE